MARDPETVDLREVLQALEALLDAVALGRLVAPAGMVNRLEGVVLTLRELASEAEPG